MFIGMHFSNICLFIITKIQIFIQYSLSITANAKYSPDFTSRRGYIINSSLTHWPSYHMLTQKEAIKMVIGNYKYLATT